MNTDDERECESMWVMTHFGILMPGLRPEGTVVDGDARLLQVRARRARDLKYLRERYQPDLGPTIRLPQTDYQFRAYCTHESWATALARMAMDINYVKFKETAEAYHGDKKLHDLYVRIWGSIFAAFSTGSSYAMPRKRKGKATATTYSDLFYFGDEFDRENEVPKTGRRNRRRATETERERSFRDWFEDARGAYDDDERYGV